MQFIHSISSTAKPAVPSNRARQQDAAPLLEAVKAVDLSSLWPTRRLRVCLTDERVNGSVQRTAVPHN